MTWKFWLFCYLHLAFAFFLLLRAFEWLPDGNLHVTMLDVGQGDALLIETPGSRRILVDGGPDLRLLEHLGDALPFWDRAVDLLVLSHADRDHLAALPGVLRRYAVENVLMTGMVRDTAHYSAFLDAVQESGARVIIAKADHDLDLGDGVVLDVLWPFDSLFGREVKEPNNASIVAKLIWKDHEILLTGDIEEDVEERLFVGGIDLAADILKAPHHGSKTSSSTGFLLAVDPDLAVISAGRDNPYGHPHQQILARYEALGIPVKRTNEEGSVELVLY